MCAAFSSWQHVNNKVRDPAVVEQEITAGRLHLAFCCRLYAQQVERGCYFLHEHPDGATSWVEPCIQKVLRLRGVARTSGDQCQLGQETDDGRPVRKRTGFMSNSPEILRQLERRCTGTSGMCSRPAGGAHAHCRGKIARRAAIYANERCEAILTGAQRQMRLDGYAREGEVGANTIMYDGNDEVTAIPRVHHKREEKSTLLSAGSTVGSPPRAEDGRRPGTTDEDATRHPGEPKPYNSRDLLALAAKQAERQVTFVDDLTGQPLPPSLCRQARQEELEYFRTKGVWELRRVAEALQRTGRRPISVRWVEVNKGDSENPKIRSRLVAREIRGPGQEACFAPTPPFESLRMVLSCAVSDIQGQSPKSWDKKSVSRMQLLLLDISRAYFNAKTDPEKPTYVQLPDEIGAPPGTCALLRKHMYGTQRAAEGWQDECSASLLAMVHAGHGLCLCVLPPSTGHPH